MIVESALGLMEASYPRPKSTSLKEMQIYCTNANSLILECCLSTCCGTAAINGDRGWRPRGRCACSLSCCRLLGSDLETLSTWSFPSRCSEELGVWQPHASECPLSPRYRCPQAPRNAACVLLPLLQHHADFTLRVTGVISSVPGQV